jgi:succinate-semialdehyde dehydrogenase / glutarate-semialdehyde dehydrogenase
LILEHKHDLACILTLENGKPHRESLIEIEYGASFLEWFAEEARRVYGDIIPPNSSDRRLLVIKQPVGVVGMITPWNFPSSMILRKLSPAVSVGCTTILKPAHETPFSAVALAELAHRSGIPPGVINIVTTRNASLFGQELCSDPIVRKISFTGSTEVGKLLVKQSSDSLKRFSLELGGNAPLIVFEDADIDEAVRGAMSSKFRSAGQTCVCTNRIFVHNKIYDKFVEKFLEKVIALKVGNGFQKDTDIGPLISQKAINRMRAIISDAVSKQARILCGGNVRPEGSLFFEPTVVTHVTPEMRLCSEEIFGPIAPIIKFHTEHEVIRLANDTIYGLAGYFYSRDVARIFRVAEALEYGMIGVNEGIISTEVAPFGGLKQSGIGREGSKYGIHEYLDLKYLCLGGITKEKH